MGALIKLHIFDAAKIVKVVAVEFHLNLRALYTTNNHSSTTTTHYAS